MPRGRACKSKKPVAFDSVDRTSCRPADSAVTVVPGITPPAWSCTYPLMVPATWACAGVEHRTIRTNAGGSERQSRGAGRKPLCLDIGPTPFILVSRCERRIGVGSLGHSRGTDYI